MITENVVSFPVCACLNPLSVLFAVLESDCYMSAGPAQDPEFATDTLLLGVILCMTEMLAQHPKASNTGQTSSCLQQAAGLSSKELNQGLAAVTSLLHSLLSNIQQQPAVGASAFNAEGETHSPTPLKSVGLIGLSAQDTEAVTVRALATLQWLNDQACTGQPPLGKHFRDLQTAIIVVLHKMLSTYVFDVHQYLQTVCVHGLVPLMECWHKYGTRVPELNDLCSAMLWQMPLSMPRPAEPEGDQKLQISGIFAMWQCFSEYLH